MRDRFLRCKVGAGLVALAGAVVPVSAAGPAPAGAAIMRAARSLYDAAGNPVRSAAVILKRSGTGRRLVPTLVLGHAGGFVGWAGER